MRISQNGLAVTAMVPPGGHSPSAKKRERAAAAVLLCYKGESRYIPAHLVERAVKDASLATGRCWWSMSQI